MSRVFFARELEGVATYWRINRRDGITLGFTSHDRDLWFDGLLHRAGPGMLPAAIRRNGDISADSAEAQGVLSHDSISARDLADGRFDGATILIGVVDWEDLSQAILYRGELGAVSQDSENFTAELHSAKIALEADPVPRTSPTCRANFCGPGCTLSRHAFIHEGVVESIDVEDNRVRFLGSPAPSAMLDGQIRWIEGPQAGLTMQVIDASESGLLLGTPLETTLVAGTRALLFEGCDHTLDSCNTRFGNAANFQGEPYLPGNDVLARYPISSS